MAESTVAMPETEQTQAVTQAENQSVETTRPREYYLTPPVDIYETPESLVVMADMPGIDPAHLDVRVDNDILTLRGQTRPVTVHVTLKDGQYAGESTVKQTDFGITPPGKAGVRAKDEVRIGFDVRLEG